MLAPVAAVVLGAGALLGLSAAAPPQRAAAMPPPVHGTVGDPMVLAGVQVTVLGVRRGAPPPGIHVAPGEDFVAAVGGDRPPRPGRAIGPPDPWALIRAHATAPPPAPSR